eukprot:TRINITY_DN24357_c0_g2_i1.p1 TRINITY_DN24357_c0_g2~~TRINITY_DN24357_c0_g2_i1.p1  ORF type:complete len:346 (-),score=62.07 TRINITY_DN24357_c0_g2_i1:24-1061(-)
MDETPISLRCFSSSSLKLGHNYVNISKSFNNTDKAKTYWVINTTIPHTHLLSSKLSNYVTMKYLAATNINVSEAVYVEVRPTKNEVKLREVYIRYTCRDTVLTREEVAQALTESLCLLLAAQEKMVMPGTASYSEKHRVWKFVLVDVPDLMVPKVYPAANWAITVLCLCAPVDWNEVIERFEEVMESEERYNEYLHDLLLDVKDERCRDLFEGLLQYRHLFEWCSLRDVNKDILQVSLERIARSSISRMAFGVGYLEDIQANLPYFVMNCGHTKSYSEAIETMYCFLWMPEKSPLYAIWCNSCNSLECIRYINIICGCMLEWDSKMPYDLPCKCGGNMPLTEDFF